MTEWFKTAFGEEYLSLYAHRDENEAGQLVNLILSRTAMVPGSLVLDAPCGAGRHLKAFSEQGMQTVGFDLSWPLLREAVETRKLAGDVVRADLRRLPFRPGCCDMVVNLFSSLGYFESDELNLNVLQDIVNLARTGGWIIIDFMHGDYVRNNLQAKSRRELSDGTLVVDTRWIDATRQRVNKNTVITRKDGRSHTLSESVRLFSPDELRSALRQYNVIVEQEFGSYDGGKFMTLSPRIILIGRRM